MKRLSRDTLDALPIRRSPRPAELPVGIVHFGPGAFHRAHQASYVDSLLDDDPRWGIAAVSMRSRGTVEALAGQDGLYTIAIRDREPGFRLIDAHRRFLGPEDAGEVRRLLADPAVRLVTSTVTEKGFCFRPDGMLDFDHPDIAADLTGGKPPRSLVGWLVAGLAERREQGLAPYVVMPCDNLAANGAKLHRALADFARAHDPALADWIAGEVRVPSTMVDSITPASDEKLYADVAEAIGLADRAAVQRESFVQWVIEDVGPLGPDLAAAGAIVTSDVGGYERAKLRILNGAHSTLAYAGLLRGAESVAQAMADPALAGFVARMIAEDIAPMLPPVPGLDLGDYARAVLERFRNPAIVHRLDQIAQDGSQKLPYRLGDTLVANRRAGRMPAYVVAAYGCWAAFLIERSRAGIPILDPAAEALTRIASDGSPADVIEGLATAQLGLPGEALADAALMTALKSAAGEAYARKWNEILPDAQQ